MIRKICAGSTVHKSHLQARTHKKAGGSKRRFRAAEILSAPEVNAAEAQWGFVQWSCGVVGDVPLLK